MSPAPALLTVRDLTVRFGSVTALDRATLSVCDGQICALIGPNGAGKTTLFNTISRLARPSAGRIEFAGADLLRLRPAQLSRLGIARTFQNLALWPGLSVIENVMVGAHQRGRAGFLSAPLGLGTRREDRRLRSAAYAALSFFGIAGVAFEPCHGLPYGTLKRVELARALVSQPRLLMLDEPASGLTHGDVRDLGQLLRRLQQEMQLTLLLVEHHMKLVMDISDYVVALDLGRNLCSGTPAAIRNDPRLVEAYLGRPT
jgi:branched-chain amino acid transport system ATP-binding protein